MNKNEVGTHAKNRNNKITDYYEDYNNECDKNSTTELAKLLFVRSCSQSSSILSQSNTNREINVASLPTDSEPYQNSRQQQSTHLFILPTQGSETDLH